MLTVMELLSNPLFSNFKLVSGRSGLYNLISGTGIFDWESSSDVEKDFSEGEFVITTLSQAKGDAAYAEHCIRLLIQKKVSAIAVKSIYFHEISEELKACSDACKIPVFFFSETFFDDIIFTIKNLLLSRKEEDDCEEVIQFLTSAEQTAEGKRHAAKEINPFFFSHIICCYFTGKRLQDWQEKAKIIGTDPNHAIYSILRYRQGTLVIYTVRTIIRDLKSEFLDFLQKLEIPKKADSLGIGNPVKGLENIGTAIQEALFANSSCLIEQKKALCFSDTGLDQLLMPLRSNPWVTSYYHQFIEKITRYDSEHNTCLMDTLAEYVRNSGDIKLTAQKLFQHGNTIRYRISKAKKILGIDDSENSYVQIFVFVRLYGIYQNQPNQD